MANTDFERVSNGTNIEWHKHSQTVNQHKPESVVENERAKIFWDVCVQTDRYIQHRRPDLIVLDKEAKKCYIVDVAIPIDTNLVKKKTEKLENYSELRVEVARMWNTETYVIPVIIGALGSMPRDIHYFLEKLDIKYEIDTIQQSVLLGTATILRQFLSFS